MLVDDHPLYRNGLRAVLARELDLDVIADVGSERDAIEALERTACEIAVIDLVLPTTNGVTLTSTLKRLRPSCRVLGLSMLEEPIRIAQMLIAGADGFALKSQPSSEIIEAIRTVLGGARYLAPAISSDQIDAMIASDDARPLRRLTTREREIFDHLVAGRSNEDIAVVLSIAVRTVETHRQHIFKKLGAHSLVELVRLGVRHGLSTSVS